MTLTEAEIKQKTGEILAHHAGSKGELIGILREFQETFGYLPGEAMFELARLMKLPASKVFGVASFYVRLKLVSSGRNVVRVCRGTACHVRGGARILREVEKRHGIKPGETTKDLEYSLETVACIGACALAPTMMLNEQTYGQMTTRKVAGVFIDRSHDKKPE